MNRFSVLDRLMAATAGLAGAALVTLLGCTLRIERLGAADAGRDTGAAGRRIFAFWHGELLPLAWAYRRRDICVLVSRHRDGECAARILKRLGFHTARGSTSDAGREGAFQMCASLRNGQDAAVAPDGPTGPRRRVQPGIVYMAQRTGAALVPTACEAERWLVLNTWDRFQVPLPFSRVVVASHAPIRVPRCLSASEIESCRVRLEKALEEAHEKALDAVRPEQTSRVLMEG
ncbi:MAG: lysophospholipid acyltransferase family protein [Candidatus Eisenbacteria bacterium]|nr:lysophospholipid acyltransferase family protein [Candidatus Eisenbacteria bacterium]